MTLPVSDVKNYTRGGQITLHNIRMFLQITNKVILVAAVIFLFVSGLTLYTTITDYESYVLSEYLWGQTLPLLDNNASTDFIKPNGNKIRAKYSDILEAPLVKREMHVIGLKILRATFAGLVAVLLACFGISRWLKKRGQTQTENILIKGDSISSTEATKALLVRKGLASDLILGGLPMVKGKETSHILFHGTIGSGKSNAMKELLDQNDPKAVDAAEALATAVDGTSLEALVSKIASAIGEYDFDLGLEHVRAARTAFDALPD